MPQLDLLKLKDLKIEALITAMKYTVRGDFSDRRQELIDEVCTSLTRELRNRKFPGSVESKIDSDGGVVFKYESSSFHFELECRPNISGCKFKDLYEHDTALAVIRTFYSKVFQKLNVQFVQVFMIDFNNVFNIDTKKTSEKNYDIFEKKIVPEMRNRVAPLIKQDDQIGRIDFKITWDYAERYICHYSLECPGNEDNTTLWTSLQIRTRDDIDVTVDEKSVSADVANGYDLYCQKYAQHLSTLLNGIELNYNRRQLKI